MTSTAPMKLATKDLFGLKGRTILSTQVYLAYARTILLMHYYSLWRCWSSGYMRWKSHSGE
jgi:hypothetical protein